MIRIWRRDSFDNPTSGRIIIIAMLAALLSSPGYAANKKTLSVPMGTKLKAKIGSITGSKVTQILPQTAKIRLIYEPAPGSRNKENLPYYVPIHVEVELEGGDAKSPESVNIETEFSTIKVELVQISSRIYRSKEPFILRLPATQRAEP